jgi:dephospho-CoA kinase
MKPVVIGLVGEMFSGKTFAAEFLVSHFNARRLKFSTTLDRILDILDLPKSRENQQKLGFILRQNFGGAVLTNAFLPTIKKSKEKVLVIDGFRKAEEIEALKRFKNFKAIYIKADIQKRFQRLKLRDEKVGEKFKDFEQFKIAHKDDAETDIYKLEQYADFVVENNGSIEEFESTLTRIYTEAIS